MTIDVKVPPLGESISEANIFEWKVKDGDVVNEGQAIVEMESDKASVEVPAEKSGKIKIIIKAGEVVQIGVKIAEIDTSVSKGASASSSSTPKASAPAAPPAAPAQAKASAPSASTSMSSGSIERSGPAARKIAEEKHADLKSVNPSGKDGRYTKSDVVSAREEPARPAGLHGTSAAIEGRHVKLTMLRKKIAERLVYSQQSTATLTTFNEVDMHNVMELRKKVQDDFVKRHGVKLGFMSLFTKAVCHAISEVPEVNARITDEEIIYHDFVDVGVAVGTDKGLVVPIIRDAQNMSYAEIEKQINFLAEKARTGKLTVDEMTGGTFTITNGGTYGSLLSTPIINPPQSGILGMHNIVKRPVCIGDNIVARPMMYIALSYDHRLIDGKGAVTFLVKVKEFLENLQSI